MKILTPKMSLIQYEPEKLAKLTQILYETFIEDEAIKHRSNKQELQLMFSKAQQMTDYLKFPVYFASDKFPGLTKLLRQFTHH